MIPLCLAKQRKKGLGCLLGAGHLLGEKYRSLLLLGIVLILCSRGLAQVETATVSGTITDQSGAAIVGAEVQVTNAETNVTSKTNSNQSGVYLVTGLKPGRYRIHVAKDGFKGIDLTDLVLNVQDSVSRNFALQVGSMSETVTVSGEGIIINTENASVSTVVDRQFAENIPLNGRSFQSLIELTPGVVVTPSTGADNGQFSVNGQRGESNYWTVDGVSANIGISSGIVGNTFGGAIGSFSVLGGTNSLVSVDALQEFRIQTSTYAPEFGRAPGGQISILTRSGTNQWRGTLFDYLRNDVLDANDWFANEKGLPKPKERQNDFGGTFGGPLLKDRTFFFFSYEGLRLRLPQTTLTTVPDLNARNSPTAVMSGMQPYLNAFPLPNGPEDAAHPGAAQFNASYSNPATLDAYSLRVDHRLKDKLSFFVRYNYSPSELDQRGGGALALSTINPARIKTQTATLGNTWSFSAAITNDFRFNYSRTNTSSRVDQDNFGGAVPLSSLGFPGPFTSQNSVLVLFIIGLTNGASSAVGQSTNNLQRQINAVDNLSWQKGTHSLKFGIDFRRLSPLTDPFIYEQFAIFFGVPSAESGNPLQSRVISSQRVDLLFKNLGVFGQDTWRIRPRLTITYGLRCDVDFAPSSNSGPNLAAVTGYNLQDLSNLALAPAGTPPFETRFGNVAPRLGLAYQISQSQEWQTVLRGGFGVFYDLATSQAGNAFGPSSYPFGSSKSCSGSFQLPGCPASLTFPLDPTTASPPSIVPPNASNGKLLFAYDPHVKLPYTLEWNVALEQALGKEQTISASYIGAAGRRLLQTAEVLGPSPNLADAQLIGNTATSDYSALQLQLNRRLSHGLQALASYTWSHSIDDGSTGSFSNTSNELSPTLNSHANRGPSDFDIRNAFSAGITYDIPAPQKNFFARAILHGWSVQNIIQARSAPSVDVTDTIATAINQGVGNSVIRPDVVPGQPLYLYGASCASVMQGLGNLIAGQGCAGGKGFNPAAFTDPPLDPSTMLPTRQGNLGRNALRGFGAAQWDFALHRKFPIHESLKLEFRAEMFNVLNHPNFGPPSGSFGLGGFGLSTEMLGQYFNGGTSGGGNVGGGAFSPLYQIGGPRSIQVGIKLAF